MSIIRNQTQKLVALSLTVLILGGCAKITNELPLPPLLLGETASAAPTPEEEIPDSLSLPIDRNDSLNPFTLTSQNNLLLMPFLYDSLYTLDEGYSPHAILAKDASFGEKSCTITLKDGIVFSDGTRLTADDVLYSFTMASSAPAYRSQLEGITAELIEGGKIRFSYPREDSLVLSLLTFPVVKKDTGTEGQPIGSGRYLPKGNTLLEARDSTTKVKTIQLINPPKEESLSYAIRSKMLDAYYLDFNSPSDFSIGAQTKTVASNKLVYLGINQNRGAGAEQAFRRTLYSLISRTNLAENSYKGRATPTYTPINPAVTWLPPMELGETRFEPSSLKEGALQYENDGLTLNGEAITLTLVVNTENSMRLAAAEEIKKTLERYKITVNLQALSYESYLSAIRSGSFDLYLGETQLKSNMSLDAFMLADGNLRYGINVDEDLLESYQAFRSKKENADRFLLTFLANPPFIPLLFRDSAVAVSRDIPSTARFSMQSLLFNITEW